MSRNMPHKSLSVTLVSFLWLLGAPVAGFTGEAGQQAANPAPAKSVRVQSDLAPLAGFSEGLAAVAYFRNGYVDRAGEWVILPTYQWAGQFSDGVARVSEDGANFFYIDRTGKRVADEVVKRHEPPIKPFKKNGKWGFLDTRTGQVVVEPIYDEAAPYSGGLARAALFNDGGSRYFDLTGREVIHANDFSGRDFHEGRAAAAWYSTVTNRDSGSNVETGRGFIDTTGKFVIRPVYGDVSDFREGLALVRNSDKCGFINHAGKIVIPIELGAAGAFSEGLAPARPTREMAQALGVEFNLFGSLPWGYIDQAGNWVIRPQYDTAGQFSEGLAHVTADDIDGFIDPTGRVVIDLTAVREKLVLDEEKLRSGEPGPVARPR